MTLYVHKIIVTVVTTDANPASVAVRVDNAINVSDQWGLIARVSDSNAATSSIFPKTVEVPDEPFDGKPDNDAEMLTHDAWVNEHLYSLL